MKKFINEFKEFINRGNVLDMGVGIIIGAAFTKIVNTLVANILMPPIGVIIGGVDFSELKIVIKQATSTSNAVTVDYGMFVNSLIDFTIIAFSVFILIKLVQKFRNTKKIEDDKICPFCASNISKIAIKCPCCTSDLN
jgi:large conductance mechanosensitive channel